MVTRSSKPERVVEQHAAFRARINALPASAQSDPGLQAVQRFLDALDVDPLTLEPAFAGAKESNALLSFQLHGDEELVCQRRAVHTASVVPANETGEGSLCLVTGQPDEVERVHVLIKNVWGAQKSGARVVSFNCDAFESYGTLKRQGANAPVGKPAAFAYTTALNHLVGKGSRNRFQVGHASTVCWAERDTEFDPVLAEIFGRHDNPDEGIPNDEVQVMLDKMDVDEIRKVKAEGRPPNVPAKAEERPPSAPVQAPARKPAASAKKPSAPAKAAGRSGGRRR